MNRIFPYPKNLRLVAFILSMFSLLNSCQEHSAPKAPPKLPVAVIKLTTSNIPVTKEYIGITESMASVDIRARVQGFLLKMNFVEGKPVKKGQLLFVIDPSPFQAQLDLAKGQLSSSIARRGYQQVQYLRLKTLVAKGDVSKSEFDQVSAQYNEAVAQVQVTTAQVEQAQINLGYTSMYSPIDGLIGHKYVDIGNLVGGTENTVLANVVQLNPIYVQFSPSVEDYNQFLSYRKNMPFVVEVTLPNNNLVFKGKMDLINNQADVPTATILMRAIIDNPENLLLPGVYVNVKVYLENKSPALLVPIKATVQTQGLYTAYVVNKDNKVELRSLQVTGQYQQSIIVKSGLKEGDQVIVNNLQKIKPGMEVIPKIASK